MNDDEQEIVKPLQWVGPANADLIDFPEAMCKEMGYAIYLAQCGEKSPGA